MAKKPRPQPVPPEPLAPLFDSHTHLASIGARTPEEVAAVMDRAEGVGVGRVCTVGDGLEEAEAAVSAAESDPRVYAAAAIHPTRSADLTDIVRQRITELVNNPRTVAVGECGLDWYWLERSDDCAPKDVQKEAFRWHINLAKSVGKPLMIHNRDANTDLLRILDDEGAPDTVIMHCFSSDVPMAQACIERGFYLSFAGPVTFKPNDELRRAAALTPSDRILVETDAPYLTPMPFRGAKNEPMLIPYTVRGLAETLGKPAEQLAAELTANAEQAFQLG